MAQMQTVDIVIVGGGPSGAATALSLTRGGLSVSVLERTRYEEMRIGETVAPAIRNPLGALGLWERFLEAQHNPSHANRSAWGSPEIHYQDFIFNPYGLGWHLDRRRFDRMLAGFLTPDSDAVRTDNTLLLEAAEEGWWYSVPLHDGWSWST